MKEIKSLDLSGLSASNGGLPIRESVDWEKVFLDVGTSPCNECSYTTRRFCGGCLKQQEYDKKFEYAKSMKLDDVSQAYTHVLDIARNFDKQVQDLQDWMRIVFDLNHIPHDVVRKYFDRDIKGEWSGAIIRAVLGIFE